MRRQLVIMVKQPVAGRVKTRLARDIGVVRATMFYRHNLAAVIARLASDCRWQTTLSVAPAVAVGSTMLPQGMPRGPQCSGDIGQRMQAILDRPIPGPVVVIGTDIPAVRPAHIWAAFKALGRSDIVFGPATDGGFWLVGTRRTPSRIKAFPAVRWSAPETLSDCRIGLRDYDIATVCTLRDVDGARDCETLSDGFGRRILPAHFPSR